MLSLFSARRFRKNRRTRLAFFPSLALLLLSALLLTALAPRPQKTEPATGGESPSPRAPQTSAPPAYAPTVSAKAAILINGESEAVYFAENADLRLPMASTTKVMTALVAADALPLDTVVKVAPEAVGVEGSSVYLYAGEELTLESLLYALLLESANDAAVAIACAVSGSVERFAERMNEKAAQLGLTDTHFTNPHGLDHEEHYTTAHDLARITAAALRSETLRTIVSTYKHTVPQSGTDGVRLFINHNRLLRTYDGCIGVKTGYTMRSGRCLVSAAERDGLLLVAVTLSDPNDWKDHAAMLDYGFSLYESVPLTDGPRIAYQLPVLNGTTPSATASFTSGSGAPLTVTLPKGHGEITARVELPRHLWGSDPRGTPVGRIVYLCDGAVLCEVPLTLEEDVTEISYRFRFFERLKRAFGKG